MKNNVFKFFVVGLCGCSALFLFQVMMTYGSQNLDRRWINEDPCEMHRLLGPLEWDDPRVLEIVRDRYLVPPSRLLYNLTDNNASGIPGFSWPFIHHYVTYFFHDQPTGFFMEAGALDGEFLSNTLWLEFHKGWSGILLEPDADNFLHLGWKRRKAWITNTCLSTTDYPKSAIFGSPKQQSGLFAYPWLYRANAFEISKQIEKDFNYIAHARRLTYSGIQCFPLATYLKALNVTTLDFLSLDTQGSEWPILKTVLGSNSTRIRSLVIEHYYAGRQFEFDPSFVKYMSDVGFHLVDCDYEPNYFFVSKDDKVLMDKAKGYEKMGLKKYCKTKFE